MHTTRYFTPAHNLKLEFGKTPLGDLEIEVDGPDSLVYTYIDARDVPDLIAFLQAEYSADRAEKDHHDA